MGQPLKFGWRILSAKRKGAAVGFRSFNNRLLKKLVPPIPTCFSYVLQTKDLQRSVVDRYANKGLSRHPTTIISPSHFCKRRTPTPHIPVSVANKGLTAFRSVSMANKGLSGNRHSDRKLFTTAASRDISRHIFPAGISHPLNYSRAKNLIYSLIPHRNGQ